MYITTLKYSGFFLTFMVESTSINNFNEKAA